jgi:hypothetical protein
MALLYAAGGAALAAGTLALDRWLGPNQTPSWLGRPDERGTVVHPPAAGPPKVTVRSAVPRASGTREAHCVITGFERTGWRGCERVRARGDRDRGGRLAHRSGADDHGRYRSGAVLPEHRRRLRFRAGRRPRPAGRRRGGGSLGQHRAPQRGARLSTTAPQSLAVGPSPFSTVARWPPSFPSTRRNSAARTTPPHGRHRPT